MKLNTPLFVAGIISGIACFIAGINIQQNWMLKQEKEKLSFVNSIHNEENRILREELNELENKPTYEQGYKAALVRVGGPQTPGAYQDGWDDAAKIFAADNKYADGYHAAIQQFGYTKNSSMTRWLVPEPKEAIAQTCE